MSDVWDHSLRWQGSGRCVLFQVAQTYDTVRQDFVNPVKKTQEQTLS
jgi:hypothetical protein